MRPLKLGLWDPAWKRATTDLCPIIKSSSNLGALSRSRHLNPLSASFSCALFLSLASCKIVFQNVSQPSANGMRSCLTITKTSWSWPRAPHYARVPRWPPSLHDIRHLRVASGADTLIVIHSKDQEKRREREREKWTRTFLVGHRPGHWNSNIEQLIWE